MKIGTDIDGTLADFKEGFERMAVTLDPTHIRIYTSTRYDMTDIMSSELRDRVFECIQENKMFWYDLKAEIGTSSLPLTFLNHNLEFYTNRKALLYSMNLVLREWLMHTFGLSNSSQCLDVFIARRKTDWMPGGKERPGEKPLDAYIDDRPEVLAQVAKHFPTTKLYLRDQPYNREVDQNLSLVAFEYTRVSSFDEMMKDIDAWGINGDAETPIRTFATGATRDTIAGKINYAGILSPLVVKCFGEYMDKHRLQKDGSLRDFDNWKKGMPQAVCVESTFRHFMDWWIISHGFDGARSTEEEALCAILFNVQVRLHDILKEGK